MNRYMMSLGGWSALIYANDEDDEIVQALAPVSLRQHEVLDAPVWQDEWIGLPRFYLNSEDGVVRFQRDVAVAERNELLDQLQTPQTGVGYELAELIGWRHSLLATLRADQPTYEELRQRLLDLAAGARSKADLIASKSPTSGYAHPVDVLRAVAEEAEAGLIKQPNARWTHAQALGKIQKILSGERWTVEDLESIAEVMRSTGYDIDDVDESEEG